MAEAQNSNMANERERKMAELRKMLDEVVPSPNIKFFKPVEDSLLPLQTQSDIVDQILKEFDPSTYKSFMALLEDDDDDSNDSVDFNLEEIEIDEPIDDEEEETEEKIRTSCEETLHKTKRPRKKRRDLELPGSQLYQFLLMLLEDNTNKDTVEWVDEENHVFRIKDKNKVAQMWGCKRERPQEDDHTTGKKAMTYDSLSRALRYYYKLGMMTSVSKKMHYRFTDKSLEEWEIMKKKSLDGALADSPN